MVYPEPSSINLLKMISVVPRKFQLNSKMEFYWKGGEVFPSEGKNNCKKLR
jgi:hypothetical protein